MGSGMRVGQNDDKLVHQKTRRNDIEREDFYTVQRPQALGLRDAGTGGNPGNESVRVHWLAGRRA